MTTPLPADPVKHLEMIQQVIQRMASNSFLIKGWSLTVSAAFDGAAAKTSDWRVALVGLAAAAAFGVLDAYYLRLERMFRNLFDAVRQGDPSVSAFSLDYRAFGSEARNSWWCVFRSPPLVTFYGGMLAVGILVAALTAAHHDPERPAAPEAASLTSSTILSST